MATQELPPLLSPDGRIAVTVLLQNGHWAYAVSLENRPILLPSELGLRTNTEDLYEGLQLTEVSAKDERIVDHYNMRNAKRHQIHYVANSRTYSFCHEATGDTLRVRFQVSNDGVAFRYEVPTSLRLAGADITEEMTAFRFSPDAKGWLQPIAEAKTGFGQMNPAYEEYYQQGIPVGTPESGGIGWALPALFRTGEGNDWVLISETGLNESYCAARLRPQAPSGEYRIGFPDPREIIPDEALLPSIHSDFRSPWRIIVVGSLATITESTLGLDVAAKEVFPGTEAEWLRPGKAAWSWITSQETFIVYDEQRRYIDLAAEMGWNHCLIDVNWDRQIGYEKIKELADYGATKGVGLVLWYNSAGNWNSVAWTPKDKLLTSKSRRAEFQQLRDMGIKGIKVDFFGGDGRSMIRHYLDILWDAVPYQLSVNFHGCTAPRGWSRTFPHLMSMEGIRGMEYVAFEKSEALQATHFAMLPFARNVFESADVTPMNLTGLKSGAQRQTTPGFELASAITCQSGIQHYSESPEGMAQVPDFVRAFLKNLPDEWTDVKLLDGFPGKEVVLARKGKGGWFIGGINGEAVEKTLTVDLSQIQETDNASAQLITDGDVLGSFVSKALDSPNAKLEIPVKPKGGFVIAVKPD